MGVAPSAGESLVNQNQDEQPASCQVSCPSCGAVIELTHRQGAICVAGGKEEDTTRVLVRVRSYRRKLLDRDNLFPKYFIDALRYSGLIRDDTTRHIILDVDQEKVETEEEERTEVDVLYPSSESLIHHNPLPLFR